MIPLASTGLILGYIDILKRLENHKINSLIFFNVILYFIYNYKIFEEFRGFPYSGIKLNIASICLFIIFALIPVQILNIKILKINYNKSYRRNLLFPSYYHIIF